MEAEHLPELAPFFKYSKLRTAATYGVYGIGGASVGAIIGVTVGQSRMRREDPELSQRIGRASDKLEAYAARKRKGK